MKTFILLSAAVLLIAQAGCTRSMRYSAEEIKDFPPTVQEHIKKGEITPGMTMSQVRYAWGAPDNVRTLAPYEDGRDRVEWEYTRIYMLKTRLVFTANSLTEIVSTEPGIITSK